MSTNPLVGSPLRGSSRSPSPSPSYHHSLPRHRHRRSSRRILSSVRKLERVICTTAKRFPLAIVYGGQTWAVYTEGWSICFTHMGGTKGTILGTLGFVIYGMAVWSYTTAIFREPGMPSNKPTAPPSHGPITVKSTGTPRFCKKCQTHKPDRAHHCSTCNRCVLKMDHHCPWLATCLGLYNYKPFLLFLIYTSLLCILSFLVSASWVWGTVLNDGAGLNEGDITPVNWILMATVSGIIGLVLTGFTIWHLVLAASGMTTIESLEKVRYSTPGLSPRNNTFAHLGNGVGAWNAQNERVREQARYNSYLGEEALAKLPHAFDLGKRQNLLDVFGARRWCWLLPLAMSREEKSRLDGWRWETSRTWAEGVARLQQERDERVKKAREQWLADGGGSNHNNHSNQTPPPPRGIGGSDRTFETRHYPAAPSRGNIHTSSSSSRLEARSAGETPAGMVKPPIPGAGLKAMESRIRNDWAFLDEDPSFSHATSAAVSSSEESDRPGSDDSEFDDSDGEELGERGGLIDHLKLRGGRVRKKDIYHQEMFGSSVGSHGSVRGGRKNIAGMMGVVPHHQAGKGGSKVDRVLGRHRYDSDEAARGEVVKLKKLKGHVPLMVAAGRIPHGESGGELLSFGVNMNIDDVGKRAGEIAERVGRGVVKAVAGVVDPGMVRGGEAKGQGGEGGQRDDWLGWGGEGVEMREDERV